MNAEFRIIHFLVDPFFGIRVPIAAVVRIQGEVQLVRVPQLPSAACLGSRAHDVTLRMVLEDLEAEPNFDSLPASVGSLVLMMEPMPVPAAHVSNAAAWLREHILPTAKDKGEQKKALLLPRRASLGKGFLKRRKVDTYVQGRFLPGRHLSNLLPEQIAAKVEMGVDPISHWISGSEEDLLMEPLVLHRPSYERDLHDIARNFAAYRHFFNHENLLKKVSLIAYLLPSEHRKRSEQAYRVLHGTAHDVVDLARLEREREFIERIRKVGETGRPTLLN